MKTLSKTAFALAATGFAVLFLSQPVLSSSHQSGMHDMKDMGQMMKGKDGMMHDGAQMPMSEGVVKKIDRAKGKVTIEHGPLDNLGMPGMTMSFRVMDEAMFEHMKEGGHIRFRAEKVDGKFAVTEVAPEGGTDEHGH